MFSLLLIVFCLISVGLASSINFWRRPKSISSRPIRADEYARIYVHDKIDVYDQKDEYDKIDESSHINESYRVDASNQNAGLDKSEHHSVYATGRYLRCII